MALSVTSEVEVQVFQLDEPWQTETNTSEFQKALLNLEINARDAMCYSGQLLIKFSNYFLAKNAHLENTIPAPHSVLVLLKPDVTSTTATDKGLALYFGTALKQTHLTVKPAPHIRTRVDKEDN